MATKPRVRRSKSEAASSDPSPLANLPAVWRFVAWVGIPGAIAGFMVYWATTSLDAKLTEIAAGQARLIKQLDEQADQNWMTVQVSSRICLNTARTDEDRMNCVTIPRRPQQ